MPPLTKLKPSLLLLLSGLALAGCEGSAPEEPVTPIAARDCGDQLCSATGSCASCPKPNPSGTGSDSGTGVGTPDAGQSHRPDAGTPGGTDGGGTTTDAGSPGTSGPDGGGLPWDGGAPPPGATVGLWTSAQELSRRPTSGAAWTSLKAAADDALVAPELYNQDSKHPVQTLAAALVYARTGQASYRAKAASAIGAIIVSGPVVSGAQDGRSLALGRNLFSYVVAADLIGLASHDPALEARFRGFLTAVRLWKNAEGRSLVECHQVRPNNWGTMCGASRIAADLYIKDTADLAQATLVLRGYLGDRSAWSGFTFATDASSWMCDPAQPRPTNPLGCAKSGHDLSGAPVDDVQRAGPYSWPPNPTHYAWGGFSAAAVQAELLFRAGYPAYGWSDQAVRRGMTFLAAAMASSQSSATDWLPWLVNARYGTSFPTTSPTGFGRLVSFTDYTHAP